METMVAAREAIDTAEATCPADLWSLASYKELLFLDSHTVRFSRPLRTASR